MKKVEISLDNSDNLLLKYYKSIKSKEYKTIVDGQYIYEFINLISREQIKKIYNNSFDLLLIYEDFILSIKEYSKVFAREEFGTIRNKINLDYGKKKLKNFRRIKLQKKNTYSNQIYKRVTALTLSMFIGFTLFYGCQCDTSNTQGDVILDNSSIVFNVSSIDYNEILEQVSEAHSSEVIEETNSTEDSEILEETDDQETEELKDTVREPSGNLGVLEKEPDFIENINNDLYIDYTDRSLDDSENRTKEYYGELIEKYSKMYGLDPKIVLGIAMQESGIHSPIMDECGTIGLMKMQSKYLLGYQTTAYNFETKQYDTIAPNLDDLKDVSTNIRIACMILQRLMKLYNYNIVLAIQSYNMGEGNIGNILDMYIEGTNKTLDEIKNNPNDLGWLEYRNKIKAGDSHYLENVFSWLGSEIELQVLKLDGTIVNLNISNEKPKLIIFKPNNSRHGKPIIYN